jgi:CubicO group peptidase (beta-lactamase class C family)
MSTPRVVATHHVSFGGGEPEHSGLLRVDERFPIASITKTLTALLAARLAVDGAVSWDVPIGPSTDVTLRALLSHTAGVPFELHPDHWVSTALSDAELESVMLAPPRLRLPPGTWHYSNLGYAVVSRVLEKATGRGYSDLLAEHLTDPLGMTHTSLPHAGEPPTLLGAAAPAGDLLSTIADLVTLARALDGRHPAVVTAPMLAMILQSSVARGDGVELGPGIRSQRVGLHRVIAATGSIRDRTTGLTIWPGRGASVLVAEVGYDHDALVDAGVQRWRRDDERVRSWWWDGQEVVELRFGDEIELRLLETFSPFAVFTGRAVGSAWVGVDALGSALELVADGDARVGPGIRLTPHAGDSAFDDPARP